MTKKFFRIVVAFLIFHFSAHLASAHEAYVLTRSEFEKGLATTTSHPLAPLFDPAYIKISAIITVCVVISYLLAILWATTSQAAILDRLIKKVNVVGPLIIRFAISASFFFSAMTNSILGPELPLTAVPGGEFIRLILLALSIMIFFGFLTQLAGLIGLSMFIFVTFVFHAYMMTYANYFGELIVLLLFGSSLLSVDKFLFGKHILLKGFEKYKDLEIPIVRILYGFALIYAGWTIKFAHQSLTVEVYNQYHLVNFFHAKASFIASGAGLSEITIGFFILIGFVQRLTTLISLFFITLSILYFREMLWPHLMLYGISLSIIINSADQFTLDRHLVAFVRNIFERKGRRSHKR